MGFDLSKIYINIFFKFKIINNQSIIYANGSYRFTYMNFLFFSLHLKTLLKYVYCITKPQASKQAIDRIDFDRASRYSAEYFCNHALQRASSIATYVGARQSSERDLQLKALSATLHSPVPVSTKIN